MERFLERAIFVVVVVLLLNAADPGIMLGAEKQTIECVVEWEQSRGSDTKMPPLTVAQLRAEFEKVAAAGAALRSWEARCRVASRYESGGTSTSSRLLISDGKQWLDEGRRGNWADGKIESRSLCDGELVRHISPHGDINVLIIQDLGEFAAGEHAPGNIPEMPPAGFPPFLLVYSEHCIPPHSFPDIGKILADPATKVLPWRTRVGGHVCYVVERTRTTQTSILGSREEIEAWHKENPKGSVIVNLDAAAKDMRIDEYTDRVALDPQAGFLAAHWASGHKYLIPAFRVKSTGRDVPRREVTQFPVEEAVCGDFRKFGDLGYVASRVELVRFSTDLEGHQKTVASQEVVLEDFQTDRHYPSDLFRFDPPKGYHVCDSIRGIQYSVGDSEEKIVALLAAAQAKRAFYEALKKKPAPPLEGAVWLNTEPIGLEDARGKHIQLHFWSIGCGACVHELPQLEQAWGHSLPESIRGDRGNYVFISIHPYVDGDDLQQLKDLLRKKQITFPVMVDSRASDGKAVWGKTSAYYHVYSEPSDVWIDEKGHVARLSSEHGCVAESDRWMGTVDDKRPKNQTEKSP